LYAFLFLILLMGALGLGITWIFIGRVRIGIVVKYFRGRLLYRLHIFIFKKSIPLTGGLFKMHSMHGAYPNKVMEMVFSNRITYEKMRIQTAIGFLNPATTSIVYGCLIGVLSMMPPLLAMTLKIPSVCIQIKPVFNRRMVKISLECIFRIKITDIIVIFKEFIVKKGGRKDVASNQ
jgi:hypothetical protein